MSSSFSRRRRTPVGLRWAPRAVVALVVALVVGAGTVSGVAPASAHVSAATVATETAIVRILADTNALRAARGLPPLIRDAQIESMSMAWTARMAEAGTISHNPSISAQMPAGWTAWAENVAAGYSYTTVVAGWARSPGHYANLTGNYTHIGIGYVESGGRTYFTQNFGRYPVVDVTGASSFVRAAYADVLGRTPVSWEIDWWVGQLQRGYSRSGVAGGFNNSDEYRIGRIEEAYEGVLSRPAEPSGLQYWLDRMRRGALQSDDASRVFLTSEEFYQGRGGGTDRGYIKALYDFVLGRPSASEEEDYWMRILSASGRGAVVDPMWMSEERLRLRAAEMYTTLLGRGANLSEQISWAAYARTHGVTAMRTALMSSAEYYARAGVRFPS